MNRRNLMKAAPVAVCAAAMTSAAFSSPHDPLVQLVEDWKIAHRGFEDATHKPGGENFDSPECLAWIEKRDALADQIKVMVPITGSGIIALLEFAWIDDGGDYAGNYITAHKDLMRNLIAGARGLT